MKEIKDYISKIKYKKMSLNVAWQVRVDYSPHIFNLLCSMNENKGTYLNSKNKLDPFSGVDLEKLTRNKTKII